jgi:plasmid stability protein
MTDILIRNVPDELKRMIEDRARANRQSLSREIEALLRRGLAIARPAGNDARTGGLGTELRDLLTEEFRSEDLIPSRDKSVRPPPDFE